MCSVKDRSKAVLLSVRDVGKLIFDEAKYYCCNAVFCITVFMYFSNSVFCITVFCISVMLLCRIPLSQYCSITVYCYI